MKPIARKKFREFTAEIWPLTTLDCCKTSAKIDEYLSQEKKL